MDQGHSLSGSERLPSAAGRGQWEMTWSEVLRGKGVRAGGGRSAVSTEPRVDVVAILTAGFR